MWKSIIPRRVVRLALFMVICCAGGNLLAQCDPPAELPSVDCEAAPLTCLNNSCYSTDNNNDEGHSGFCGPNTLVHNPQYFLFEAMGTTAEISILINNCTSGAGLQSAIIDINNQLQGCDQWVNDDVIACDPNFNGSTTMNAAGLDSGTVYLLLIDGSNAATCEYTITQAAGVFEPDLQGDLSGANANAAQACPGDTTWSATAFPPVGGAHGYIWSGMPGGDVTSTTTTLSVMEDAFDGIPADATPGIYNVCVTPFSGCDTSDVSVCFDFEIYAVDDGTADPDTFCQETYDTFGVPWGNMTITSPGTYTQEFYTQEGCPHDTTKTFEAWPVADVGQIDTVVCGLSLTYEGDTYSTAGSYDLFYDDASQFGCDSNAVLNVEFASVTADPSFECDLGDFQIMANMSNLVPSTTTPTFVWRDENGNVVSNDADWTTQMPGSYTLEIILTVNGEQCVYPDGLPWSVDIIAEDIFPDEPVIDEADSVICSSQLGIYSVIEGIPGDIIEYNWQVPPGAIITGGDGTNEISIDWQNATSGGQVCASWSNECGESDPVCFNVEVVSSPVPLFNVNPTALCVGEAVDINFGGTASANASYDWDFDNGTVINGGTGPGPHQVTWSTTGTKDIKLVLSEPGCAADSITLSVDVSSLGSPVINCSSTTSSITFQWSSVNGSTGFVVNELPGPNSGTMVNDTTYEVTGLNASQSITLEVIAQGNGICPQTADTITCQAEDCQTPTWAITAPDSLCEIDAAVNLTATVNGSAATGTWSGPGITDPANGTFEPLTAGTGTHTVVFNYSDGLCSFNFQENIVVVNQPNAAFTADAVLCEDTPATITYTGAASPTATYNWDFDGGQILSGSGQGPYSILWSTPGTKTVSLTVDEFGCLSDLFTVQVQLDTLLGIPMLNCNSSTTSVEFVWSDVTGASSYSINVLSGATGTRNGNSYSVQGLTPGDMITVELIANNVQSACPPTADTLTCTAQDCPSPIIVIGPVDTSICLYTGTSSFDMDVMITGGNGTGQWSGPGIVDAAVGTFDPNAAGPGQHTVTFEYVDQSCTFTEETDVFVFDIPQAVISNTDFTLTCENNNELDLDGTMSTGPGNLEYLWTTLTGNIKTPPDLPTVTAGAPGTYELMVTDPVSGCTDVTSVVLVQDDNVPNADAGDDQELNCDVETVMLGGSSSNGPDIDILWSTTAGRILSDPTEPTIMVDAPGMYTLTVADSVNGCISTDEVEVTENNTVPTIMLSEDGILTCDNQDVAISSEIMGGSGNYSYDWSTTDGTIAGATDSDAVTAISPGTYMLVVEDLQNGCSDSSTVEVIADDDVIASLDDAFSDITCFGDADGSISVVGVTGGSQPYSYAWSNGSDEESLSGVGPGDYTVTVTDANGCSFQQTWTITEPPQVTAEIGDDIRTNVGDSVMVNLQTSVIPEALGSIQWDGIGGPCDGCYSLSFTAEQSGEISVAVVDSNGCAAFDALQLSVVRERTLFVPNVFSPNDDGVNDRFTVYGRSIVNVQRLTIYDRWGNVLYNQEDVPANDEDFGWDGRRNDEEVVPGVYVYYAKVVHDDEVEEEIIGDVTLVK